MATSESEIKQTSEINHATLNGIVSFEVAAIQRAEAPSRHPG